MALIRFNVVVYSRDMPQDGCFFAEIFVTQMAGKFGTWVELLFGEKVELGYAYFSRFS